MMRQQLKTAIYNGWRELRANRRLQWGALAILAILVVEGGMRWGDHLSGQQKALLKLQGDVAELRSRVRHQADLEKHLAGLSEVRQAVEERLWSVPSEAVGQARLKEWIEDVLKRSGATGANLTLSGVALPGGRDPLETNPATKGGAPDLREFRASVRMNFSPAALEKVLAEIEGGNALGGIESLSVNRRERRAEFTLFVLMRVAHPHAAGSVQ